MVQNIPVMYTAAVLLVLCLLPLLRAVQSSSCTCNDVTDLLKSQVDLLSKICKPSNSLCEDDTPAVLQSCNNSLTHRLDEIADSLEEVLNRLNTYSPLPRSCDEIKSTWPNTPTGYYTIVDDDGLLHHVHCNMDTLCGSDGSWTRVAYLNMSDTTQQCPSTLRLYEQDGVRACGRPTTNSGSYASVNFTTLGNYTEVCGRVIGYQYGRTGGINPYGHASTLDQTYVDGVSLTRGSPRQHIWTFITSYNEVSDRISNNQHSCPCVFPDSVASLLPSFLGDDWFCESGSSEATTVGGQFYNSDPLWDGEQCGPHEPCCNTTGQPWFRKTLDSPSSDYLELRVCENSKNTGTNGVDSLIVLYEIYIK